MRRQINVGALYGALDAKRTNEGMSWRELGAALDVSPSVFTRMAQGRRPDVDTFLTLVGWLGVAAERFTDGDAPSAEEAEETVAVISTYLRADRTLKPKSAEAIETILRAAYEQLAEK
jgi:transcriptional regulator with XRE-family HTH domain